MAASNENLCEKCFKTFGSVSSLNRHKRTVHKKNKFHCEICFDDFDSVRDRTKHKKLRHLNIHCTFCSKMFLNSNSLRRHSEMCRVKFQLKDKKNQIPTTLNKTLQCVDCGTFYKKQYEQNHIRSMRHIEKCLQTIDERCAVYQTALKENLTIYKITNTTNCASGDDVTSEMMEVDQNMDLDASTFLESLLPCVEKCMMLEQQKKECFKFRINLHALFSQIIEANFLPAEENIKHFYSDFVVVTRSSSFSEIYETACREVTLKSEDFEEMKSGWTLLRYMYLTLEFAKCDFFKASSFIPTPKFIQEKKCSINVKNVNDSKCFLYAVLASTVYNELEKGCDRNSPKSYKPYFHLLDMKGISYPTTTDQIKLFEKQNPDNSVNVFTLEGDTVCGPIYLTKQKKKRHANLLLIEEKNKTHYISIISLSRLVNTQMSGKRAKFFCDTCLSCFKSLDELQFHEEIGCTKVMQQLPDDDFIEFKKYQARQMHPCCFYGDLESILVPTNQKAPLKKNIKSFDIHNHETAAVAYTISSIFNDKALEPIRIHRGHDALDVFTENLIRDVKYIYSSYLEKSKHLKMEPITSKIKKRLEKQKHCYLCLKEFGADDVVVIDHQHWGDSVGDTVGKIRGKACRNCNLLLKAPTFIPFFWHSGMSYDFHPLLTALSKVPKVRLQAIPKTNESFLSFSAFLHVTENKYVEVRFLDSYRFLPSSLATLTKTVEKCETYTKFHEKTFKNFKGSPQKQFYPYEYMDSFSKFDETEFPKRKDFYSHLKDEAISKKDYKYAKSIFNSLPKKTLGDYCSYYLTCDCLLLRDVFQSFRHSCFERWGIDPAFFITTASLSYNIMLDYTKEKLHLMTDLNMINLIKNNIRGGISNASLRYSESNNEYLEGGYDREKGEKIYNMYMDCNALYSYTISNFRLPHSNFEWCSQNEIDELSQNFMSIGEEDDTGYVFVVDVKYPKELHDLHGDLPFLSESMKIGKVKKLTNNLFDKTKYVCHYRILQQAVRHGLIVTKFHKAIKFIQKKTIAPYIDKCMDFRKVPGITQFEVMLMKIFANVIYGKTCQTDFERDIKLITKFIENQKGNHLDGRRLIKDPRFKHFNIITPDFVSVEMQRKKILLNKPSMIGFAILELSKYHMFDFYYDFLKPILKDSITLGYQDTDSYVTEIRNVDFYKEIVAKYPQKFDTSNFEIQNQFGIIPQNAKVPGLFKIEGGSNVIYRTVALKSKCYSIDYHGAIETVKKLKSVSKTVTNSLTFNDYYNTWKNKSTIYSKMFQISSKKHLITTVKMHKKSLSPEDDKRIVLEDGRHTRPLGHYLND